MAKRSLVALSMLLLAAPASAQSSCVHLVFGDDGEIVFETRFAFDASGRIASIDSSNDAAAYSATTVNRYDERGELVEQRVNVIEGADEGALGWGAPIAVTTERADGRATVRAVSDRPEHSRVEIWDFDERGLPSRVERTPSEYGGDRPEVRTCAFDVAGRPIYSGGFAGHSPRNERRWIWSGDTLVRIENAWTPQQGDAGEETLTVRRRGRSLEVRDARGAIVEDWTGSCDQVLYGICAPIHAPLPPGGARVTLPPSRGDRVAPPRRRTGPAFPEAALGAPLTLASLRAAYRSRAVWTTASFYENSPDTPMPIVCVGPEGGQCLTMIEHGDDARARRVTTRDPSLVGPARIRVGVRYERIAARLEACERRLGLEQGFACRVRGAAHVLAWFDPYDGIAEHDEDAPPSPAELAGRRVAYLDWSPP